MKKRILSLITAVALIITLIPTMMISALAVTINDDEVFLLQSGSGKCTLTSATMMLRRRAIIDGMSDWDSITDSSLGAVAWVSGTGMRYNYTFEGMSVVTKSYSGMSYEEKKAALISMLDNHPEGIEIYDGSLPHAVLLTDYDAENDIFYCADPATAAARIPLSKSWNAKQHGNSQEKVISNISKIWYISNKSGGGPGLVTVTLDANGGSCSESNAYISADGTISSLPTPTREGYSFTGWYTAASGGTKITSSYKFSDDATIYAQWKKLPCITLDANGGSCSVQKVYASADGKVELPTPTLEGFKFLGWYDAKTGGNKISSSTIITGDITVYAQWQDTTIRGTCGTNLSWSLNEDTGILKISGTGEMDDYTSASNLGAPWYKYADSVTKVVVSSGVKTIGSYAFANLKKLTSVEIDSELKKLGDGAFYGCSALSNLDGIDGVKSIGDSCFYGCSSLSVIGVPTDCTSIGSYAYSGTAISSISVPKSVTSIGEGAFSGCTKLSYAELPSGLSTIPSKLFSGCTALKAFIVNDDSSYGGSGTTIKSNAFSGCTALSEIVIYSRADSLRIEKNAFSGCTAISSVNLDCKSLILDGNAFPKGANINYIRISGEYGSVASNAFEGVTTTIVYPKNNTKWEDYKGNNYGGTLTWESYDNHVHEYTVTVVAPTCSEQGYSIYECKESSCGEKFEGSYVRQLGHSFKNGVCTVCGAKNPFRDIDAQGKHVYYTDAILWAYNNGITEGTSATTFAPDDTCTRAQVVTFLWRLAGEPKPSSTKCGFVDVSDGLYYTDAVLWAAENGITAGVDETHFAPNAKVTRAQFVTFLWRYLDRPVAGGYNPFTDVAKSYFAYSAILWAYENGVTSGTSTTTFSPEAQASRAQVVTFLYRMNNIK